MTNCLTPSCKWRPPGTCVYYSGDNLPEFSIANGDNLDVIVNRIATYLDNQSFVETANSATNSNSTTVTLSGTANRNIKVDVKRDAQADNKLAIGVNGLYVPPTDFSTDYNAGTGEFTLTIDGVSESVTLAGAVQSFNGRTGVVVPEANDYSWAQIGSKPTTLAGLGVTDPVVLTSSSYADPGWIISLAKAKVGLGNVVNLDTSNASNISSGTLSASLIDGAIARLANPAFTGSPTAPTPTVGDDSTRIATTEFVQDTVAAVTAGVVSFNGRSGVVTSQNNDYTWAQINKTSSSLADITTRSAGDLTSGTLSDSRLSGNVPLLNVNNTFTGTTTLSTLASGASTVVRASTTGQLSGQTPADLKTDLALVKADVGLGNVVNVDQTDASNLSTGTVGEARLPLLTGYTAGAGTVSSADSYKEAIQKLDGNISALSTGVTSVFGRTGVVTAQNNDYTWAQINKATSSLADITTRSAGDLSSGTLLDARLSSNVPLKNTANTYSATNNFNSVTVSTGNSFSLYNTVDQTTNYERLLVNYTGNNAQIYTVHGGTGTARSLVLGGTSVAGATTPDRSLTIRAINLPTFEFTTSSSGSGNFIGVNFNLTAAAGAATAFAVYPTLNNSATAAANAVFISPYIANTGSGGTFLLNVGTNSATGGAYATHNPQFTVSHTGAIVATSLAGSGTRVVKADSNGLVSASALATSDVSGLDTALQSKVTKLFAQNTQQSVTGSTAETTVLTTTIPGGSIGVNGAFEFHILFSGTNNANVKTLRVKLNGTTISAPVVTSLATQKAHVLISNRNSLSSQVMGSSGNGSSGAFFGGSSGVIQTFSFNTAADITLTVTLQLANGADSIALEAFTLLGIY